MSLVVLVGALLAAAGGQAQNIASECPSPDGFFADAEQCDKYYSCADGVLTEKLCPDGMAFNDLNPRVEKCDFHYQIDCKGRSKLQPAKPTENCPRQNGYFPHPEQGNCHQFYYCAGGTSSQLTCPEGLSFSLKSGTCVWPDSSGRENCVSSKLLNFTCPAQPATSLVAHPRYVDPADCQHFYVCINGKEPRRNGCSFGQVFNNETKICDAPKNVPDCSDFYMDFFDDYFATLDTKGGRISADIIAAAIASDYPVPEVRERVRLRPQGPAPTRRGPNTQVAATTPAQEEPNRPFRRRRPAGGILRRRRPTTTTTTTTTTTPPPEYYYDYYEDGDYYYYDDATEAPTTDSSSVSRNSLPSAT